MRKKLTRILALIGAAVLVAMYLVVFYLGLTASPAASNALMAAIGCTIVIPVLLYAMMLMARVLDNRQNTPESMDPTDSSDSSSQDH